MARLTSAIRGSPGSTRPRDAAKHGADKVKLARARYSAAVLEHGSESILPATRARGIATLRREHHGHHRPRVPYSELSSRTCAPGRRAGYAHGNRCARGQQLSAFQMPRSGLKSRRDRSSTTRRATGARRRYYWLMGMTPPSPSSRAPVDWAPMRCAPRRATSLGGARTPDRSAHRTRRGWSICPGAAAEASSDHRRAAGGGGPRDLPECSKIKHLRCSVCGASKASSGRTCSRSSRCRRDSVERWRSARGATNAGARRGNPPWRSGAGRAPRDSEPRKPGRRGKGPPDLVSSRRKH